MNLPFRIRQSSLLTAQCLYHFQQNLVLGIKDPESEFARRGTDFHELAKRYVDFLRSSQQMSDWEYGDELVDAGSWNQEAEEIFKNWIRSQSFETETIFATEYQIRLDWDLRSVNQDDPDANDRIVYSADLDRLDIVGRKAKIRDYKTFWGTTSPSTIQATVYAWMLFKIMPHIEEVDFELEFVRWGIVSEPKRFTREDLPQMDRYMRQQVARVVAAYEADEWPAAINNKCCYCSLKCPLVAQGMDAEAVGQVQTDERAAEMAQQLYALHLAAKRLHANLKNWATRSGTIDAGNDIRLGFKKVQKWKMEPKVIMGLNSDHGFAPTRALSVDSKEVKKIGKNYKEYADAAYKSGKDKSTTAFKFWNEIGDPLDMDEEED